MDGNKTLTQESKSTPDLDETRLRRLSEFVVSMVQAFLRTGYYTSEHPESHKARTGLYAKFMELLLKKGDLTFLVQETAEKKHVFVEGMLPEPCDLKTLMLAGMAELYDEKLRDFLGKKELISLTLKQKIEEQEFYDFIDIMSKPILTDIHDKHKRDRFIFYLQEKGIKNISFIFSEDLIKWERNIPWRAWVALSRLRKDISLIPVLRNLEKEELWKVKKEVVSDVLRPLKDPKLSFATLVNSDLIHSKVMEEEEIEKNVIDSLSEDMLSANVEEFIHSSSHLKQLVHEKAYDEKLLRILDYFKERLKVVDGGKSETCIRKLYKNGMISFDELPSKLKEEIALKKFLKTFLNDPDAVLTGLNQSQDAKDNDAFMKSISGIMPWLVEGGRFQEFQKILLILQQCVKEGGERGKQAGAVLEQIGSSDIPVQLKDKFMSSKKEARLALTPIIRQLGGSMTVPLLAVIEETQDRWVRKNAIELLLQMEPIAASYLEQALKVGRFQGEVVADVIKAVATAGNQEAKRKMAPVINEYCNHQDPSVRKYALSLLADVHRIKAETTLLDALNDSDTEVRKSVITCLGVIKSKKALPVFLEILKDTMESPSQAAEQIENQIYWALGLMEDDFTNGATTPEEILIKVLHDRAQTGTISRLLGKKGHTLSDQSIGIICDSLGTVGTELSESVLTELAKNGKKPWAVKAQQALEKIEERHAPASALPRSSDPLPEMGSSPTD